MVPTIAPVPYGIPAATVEALGSPWYFAVADSIVNNSQAIPNEPFVIHNDPASSVASPPLTANLTESDEPDFTPTTFRNGMEELCASMPHYNQLLEMLKITKGPLKGE